jgi:hypothetical protein
MAEEYKVVSVREVSEGLSMPAWLVKMERPDGNMVAHLFPQDTLEWRAAEYGIEDVDELLDIVLHEPYQPPTDATEAEELGVERFTKPTLMEADSTSEARENHRARISRAKAERVRVVEPKSTKGGKSPLDAIRQKPGIDPDRMRAKREAVDMNRWINKYGALPVAPPSEAKEIGPRGWN